MNNHPRRLLIALAATPLVLPAQAAGPTNVDACGVAIHGHDLVADFVDGKLYLNLNPAVQKRWQADMPGFIDRANQSWPKLKGP